MCVGNRRPGLVIDTVRATVNSAAHQCVLPADWGGWCGVWPTCLPRSSPVLNRLPEMFDPAGADRCYTADILSAPGDIERLTALVRRLAPVPDRMGEPSFFLASLSAEWIPRVVVVRRGAVAAGVVYTKERRIGGFRTGISTATAASEVSSSPTLPSAPRS